MKQRRNPLSHLGWLGFLGILGILSGAVTMLVFFLFFFFFTYRAKIPDELFWNNVHKAATRTLAVNLTLTCLVLLSIYARGMHYRLGIPAQENGVYLGPRCPVAAVPVVRGLCQLDPHHHHLHIRIHADVSESPRAPVRRVGGLTHAEDAAEGVPGPVRSEAGGSG